MGDIRDQLLQNQAREEMDVNAVIKDICCTYDLILRVVGDHNDGGMMGIKEFPDSGENRISISKSKAEAVFRCKDRAAWVNDNWASLHDGELDLNMFTSFSSDVDVYIDIQVKVGYDLEYYNGENISIVENISLNSTCTSELLQLGIGGEVKIEEKTPDSIKISSWDFNDITYENDMIQSENSSFSEILLTYLSNEDVWSDAKFGTFVEQDNTLQIPVYVTDNVSYTIDFYEPFDDSNKIWKLAEEFGYDDPCNIENEHVEYSIHSVVRDKFRQSFIRLRNPDLPTQDDTTKNTGIISRFFNIDE